MAVVVVVNENDAMVDLINAYLNIDDRGGGDNRDNGGSLMIIVVDLDDILEDGQGRILEVELERLPWLLVRGGGGRKKRKTIGGETNREEEEDNSRFASSCICIMPVLYLHRRHSAST